MPRGTATGTRTRRNGRRAERPGTTAGVILLLVVGLLGVPFGPALADPAGAPVPSGHPSDTSMDPIPPTYPFVCTTAREGLGQPKIDNQDGQGIPVAEEDENGDYPKDGRGYPTAAATIVGWSRDCEIDPVIEYRYRATDGQYRVLDDPTGDLPADIATTTTTDGDTVPYIIRWERGTINRYIYSVAMLAPTTETDPWVPDDSLWNGRAIFSFSGGVAIGRTQGRLSVDASMYDAALRQGYAVLSSTGTRTSTTYNLTVSGQTAVMLKEHFVDTHGDPIYTVAVGGSGGGIQQYVYAQNHPGLLDGGIPQYSYSDMITQAVHIGDCELIEHWFEMTAADRTRWTDVEERELIEGLNSERTPRNLSSGDISKWNQIYGLLYPVVGATPPATAEGAPTPGLTECRNGWFGLTPLVLNPTFTDVDDIDKLAEGTDGVEWTHAADAINVYGVDETGYGRNPWDNVGVQYGLEALADGDLSSAEFLDLNSKIGSWKEPIDMVEEGCPFVGSKCTDLTEMDPWSARQMQLSPDDGVTPAPRREGDLIAMQRAYETGLVFRGAPDIPFIDWRHYLEEELDMHNTSQSFVTRQRMIDESGNHDNQVVWFTDARPSAQFDQTAMALDVLHDWITNIQANPAGGVGGNKPAAAVDSCFATDGSLLHSGDDVWDGILDDGAAGACTEEFPVHSTSRRQAGGPITGSVFKCQTKTVVQAVADGDYGAWTPTGAEIARLEHIFPDGVCDYDQADAGDPRTEDFTSRVEAFVRALESDISAAEPSDDLVEAGVEAMRTGTRRATWIAQRDRSPEALARAVDDAFELVLGRPADERGREYWASRLYSGMTLRALVVNLLASPELYARGGGTPEGYVEEVYRVTLGRSADPAGVAYWAARLRAGEPRSRTATVFYNTPEARRVRVTNAYDQLLGRAPSAADLTFWAGRLARVDDLALRRQLLATSEYFANTYRRR